MIANADVSPVVLWLKRDLRLRDNPAMSLAQELGPTIILAAFEPSLWTGNDFSKRHLVFYLNALDELNKSLIKLNVSTYIVEDEFPKILQKLLIQIGKFTLVSHQETGNWTSYKRDERVKSWCTKNNITWFQPRQNNVIRNLKDRDLWTKYWSNFMSSSCKPIPKFNKNKFFIYKDLTCPFIRLKGQSTSMILDSLKLKSKIYCLPETIFPIPSNKALKEILESFFISRAIDYRKKMSSPLTSIDSCSRLSPYLAWGLISIREVYHELKLAQEYWKSQCNSKSSDMLNNLRSFEKRLHWRCHFIQKLETEPEIEFRSFHPSMNNIRDKNIELSEDKNKLDAWKNGFTGIDYIDACMNFLRETGWLNFRMRAMLMSFASYNLWLDWRKPGEHLARLFLDYEPGIHWPQVQMQSGTSGINTIRIYNPHKQQKDHDPKLTFTHKWANPTILSQAIVSVQETSSLAKRRIWEVKKTKDYNQLSKAVFLKHGSRLNSKKNVSPRDLSGIKLNRLSNRNNMDLFE